MVLAGDVRGDADGDWLAARVDALRPGRHADPGALAMVLETGRVLQARDDAHASGVPGLVLSWIEQASDGSTRRFLHAARAPSVAAARVESRGRDQAALSARDAIVRAQALGVPVPAPPDRVARVPSDLDGLRQLDRRTHTTLVRLLASGPLGISEGGDLWWRDPDAGGWVWIAPTGVSVGWAPADDSRDDLVPGAVRWDRPTRCLVQAGWPGVTPHPECTEAPAVDAP